MEVQKCIQCGKIKPIGAFRLSFGSKTSRQARCGACYSVRDRIKKKLKFVSMYGGMCACCGLDDPRFLTLDHIKNDGKGHREELYMIQIYRDALNSYQPDRYQILCFNCNMGKGANGGVCPHKEGTKEEWLLGVAHFLDIGKFSNSEKTMQAISRLLEKLTSEELQTLMLKYIMKEEV